MKAERVGFEPTIPCGMPVFKTGAIDLSAIAPKRKSGLIQSARIAGEGLEPPASGL